MWLTAAAANLKCLCSSRFHGVGGGGEGEEKRWGVLAIHIWSKSRYIECVILASLYLMEAPIRLPSFFWWKIPHFQMPAFGNKVLFFPFTIDIWVYYTAVCFSHIPHPVPTSLFHIELYICLHTKKPKIKYKTPLQDSLVVFFLSSPSTPTQFVGGACKSLRLLYHFSSFH